MATNEKACQEHGKPWDDPTHECFIDHETWEAGVEARLETEVEAAVTGEQWSLAYHDRLMDERDEDRRESPFVRRARAGQLPSKFLGWN